MTGGILASSARKLATRDEFDVVADEAMAAITAAALRRQLWTRLPLPGVQVADHGYRLCDLLRRMEYTAEIRDGQLEVRW